MKSLELGPIRRVAGRVRLPGSKSICNRVLLLAALARGKTVVRGLLDADDTRLMLEALRKLKIPIDARNIGAVSVIGQNGIPSRRKDLFLGNAGTAFRPLAAVLALSGGDYKLMGTPRMHERPIGDLVDALRSMGARIEYLGKQGFPPLYIKPAGKKTRQPVRVRGDVSSQYLSALLMALPLAGGGVIEVEGELISQPYVQITTRLMRKFGVGTRRKGWQSFLVPGSSYVAPKTIQVEGDASSASYFLAAGAIGGGPVRVEGVGRGSIQGDVRFCEVLEAMGARVSMGDHWIETSSQKKLKPIDLDLNHIPDAAMTAAVTALFASGPSTIRNIASWRVKETDRIAAMAKELGKLGAVVVASEDSLRIEPPKKLNSGVSIDTYDDHRMAMCFSLVALGGVPVMINDPDCVAKTFPDYFAVFSSIAKL